MDKEIIYCVKDSGTLLLKSGTITHIYGPPKSGKSTISANIALELARNGFKVMMISTERPIEIRMDSMIIADDNYSKHLLNNILTSDIYSYDELIQVITKELPSLSQGIDAIIIDSLTSAYRFKAGPISLTLLRKALSVLQSIVAKDRIALLFTNQVSSKMDETSAFRPVASATTRSYSDRTIRLTKKIDQSTEISFEDMMGNEIEVLQPIAIKAAGFDDFTHYFKLKLPKPTHIAY